MDGGDGNDTFIIEAGDETAGDAVIAATVRIRLITIPARLSLWPYRSGEAVEGIEVINLGNQTLQGTADDNTFDLSSVNFSRDRCNN